MLQPRIPCAKNKPVLAVALRFALRLASILRLVWVLIFGRACLGHAKVFAGPGAEIQVFAALVAKRAKRVAAGIQTGAAAARADDPHRPELRWLWLIAHAHRASSKLASALLRCGLSSGPCCIKRTETSRRLALISGIRASAGSSASRSN